ncbi:MAG: DMT family transporter, partial [Pseudomonadota bacterium]|nr:DMT family transporter [Pseudomonadota bacterium]
ALIGLNMGGVKSFKTKIPGWHFLRTCLMSLSSYTFFAALALLPLVNIMVIVFIAPIIITALSGPLLKEDVGVCRWSAVLIGFFGVIVILQPSAEFSSTGTIYAVIGVITYSLTALTARKLSDRESASNLSFYIFIGPTLLGAIGSYYSWIPLNPWDFFLFFLTGLTGGLAFIFFNLALQKAEASLLTSFEYTGLIWASLAGYFIFNEIVDSRVWLGAAIIIMCGIVILFRESRLAKTNENSAD